jgi:hypothetical protein
MQKSGRLYQTKRKMIVRSHQKYSPLAAIKKPCGNHGETKSYGASILVYAVVRILDLNQGLIRPDPLNCRLP